uniref:WAT1-related protein n=1 Tax=Rhizophora mucronata TaxID=61149 RepID=A0A2P2M271_RHIMU
MTQVWTMYSIARLNAPAAQKMPPLTQFAGSDIRSWLGEIFIEDALVIGGPLHKVIINAPAIDKMVPMDLA